MPKQVVPKAVTILLICVSVYGTVHLGHDYFQAIFGIPEAQWQIAFALVPIPVILGAAALAIAKLSRPALSRPFVWSATTAAVVPLVLLTLVLFHAY